MAQPKGLLELLKARYSRLSALTHPDGKKKIPFVQFAMNNKVASYILLHPFLTEFKFLFLSFPYLFIYYLFIFIPINIKNNTQNPSYSLMIGRASNPFIEYNEESEITHHFVTSLIF